MQDAANLPSPFVSSGNGDPSDEREHPERGRDETTSCSFRLIAQPSFCKQLSASPPAVSSQRGLSVGHARLPVPVHAALVRDRDGRGREAGERERTGHQGLGGHVMAAPIGWSRRTYARSFRTASNSIMTATRIADRYDVIRPLGRG